MTRVNARRAVLAAAAAALVAALPIGEAIEYDGIMKIKQQGLNPQSSQVMEIASWLTDVYGPRLTHHTNLDAYDRLQPADMMKNATIAAAFAYLAANRDEMLPRKPAPVPAAGRGTR